MEAQGQNGRNPEEKFMKKLVFLVILMIFNAPLEGQDKSLPGTPFIGGTLWEGKIPSSPEQAKKKDVWYKLLWKSKVKKVNFRGRVEGGIGPAWGRADIAKAYNLETKRFEDATLKTRVSVEVIKNVGLRADTKTTKDGTTVYANANVKVGVARVDYNKKVISPNKNKNDFTNTDGKQVKIASGFGIMDAIKGAFGVGWSKKFVDGFSPGLSGAWGGKWFYFNKSKGNTNLWAGNDNVTLGFGRNERDQTLVSATVMPFVLPVAKAGVGIDLQMVPMTPKEIEARNKRAILAAERFDRRYSNAMAENLGFGLWQGNE